MSDLMTKRNIDWMLYKAESLPPGSGGMADVGGLKRLQFKEGDSLILKGKPDREDIMDFVLQDNVMVPTAINNSPVEKFVGGTMLRIRIEAESENELILVLISAKRNPPEDVLKLIYKRVN